MDRALTNDEKEQIRQLRAKKNPDGSHIYTLDALGERFGVSHQRISQIVNPGPQRERNRRRLARPKTKLYQKRYQKGYIKRYMRHYRHHMQAGVYKEGCGFCRRRKNLGQAVMTLLVIVVVVALAVVVVANRTAR